MPINSGNTKSVNGYREPRETSVHEYFQTQDTLLRAAAERKEQLDNLLTMFRAKVQHLLKINAQDHKSNADKKLIEGLTKNILNLGAMLKSKGKLSSKECKFLEDLLASHGPVQVTYLARGASLRNR